MSCELVGETILGLPIIEKGYCSTPSKELGVLVLSIIVIIIILLYLKQSGFIRKQLDKIQKEGKKT